MRYMRFLLVVSLVALVVPVSGSTLAQEDVTCNVPAPEETANVSFLGWSFDIMDFYAEELEACGQVENIDVSVQFLEPSGVDEAMRLALSSGTDSPYDIVHGANIQMIEWGNEGWLLPLDDLIEEYGEAYNLDDIPANAFEGATIDGQIYGIPVTSNTLHLAYRADLFEQYDLDVPTNYDEVIEACDVLDEDPSIDLPFTMDLSAGWAWEIEYLAFARSYGASYLDEEGYPVWNSPEGVAALTKMKDVVDACMGPLGLTYGYEANEVAMNNGALAFTHIWAGNTISMNDPERSDFADEIAFAPAAAPNPDGALGGSTWNDYYVIPVTTTNDPELLFQMIMEALDRESAERGAEFGIVTRTSVEEGVPSLEATNETIANGIGIYEPRPEVVLAQIALSNHLAFVGTGEKTPQEALDDAAAEYIVEATAQGYLD